MDIELDLGVSKLLRKPDYILFYSFQPISSIKGVYLYKGIDKSNDKKMGIRNPAFMEAFIKEKSIDYPGSGGSLVGLYNHYKNYLHESKLLVVFNSDNMITKYSAFSKLTKNSIIVIIGHCCKTNSKDSTYELFSDYPEIIAENGDKINNPNKNASYMASTISFYCPQLRDTIDKIIIDLYVCNGSNYISDNLVTQLKLNHIDSYVISKGIPTKRLGGLLDKDVRKTITEHFCSDKTFIHYLNSEGKNSSNPIDEIIKTKIRKSTYGDDIAPVFLGGNLRRYLRYRNKYFKIKN